jgi:hypothetical protein
VRNAPLAIDACAPMIGKQRRLSCKQNDKQSGETALRSRDTCDFTG